MCQSNLKKYLLGILCFVTFNVYTQNLLINGDFENNSSPIPCNSNLDDATFTMQMDNITAFGGDRSELDIYQSGCFSADPQSGLYKIAFIASDINSCNIAFDLSSPIISAAEYSISFWFNPSSEFSQTQGEMIIGVSNDNMAFGTEVFRDGSMITTSTDTWTNITGTFIAPEDANFLTVAALGSNLMWAHLDNFSLVQIAPPGNGVPTLSEWGLIILSLLFLIFGIACIKQFAYADFQKKQSP